MATRAECVAPDDKDTCVTEIRVSRAAPRQDPSPERSAQSSPLQGDPAAEIVSVLWPETPLPLLEESSRLLCHHSGLAASGSRNQAGRPFISESVFRVENLFDDAAALV